MRFLSPSGGLRPFTLVLAVSVASLAAACGSSSDGDNGSEGSGGQANVGATPPVKDSTLEADLKAAGVDPKNPPDWATLSKGFTSMAAATPVMSLFAKSLGVQCTDCHSDPMFGVPAGRKNIVTRMWDNWVHGLRLKDGGTLFCDSCHQGKEEFLDRKDDAALTAWMQANFVAKFTRADGQAQTCASCHGTPFNKSFLDDWEAGK